MIGSESGLFISWTAHSHSLSGLQPSSWIVSVGLLCNITYYLLTHLLLLFCFFFSFRLFYDADMFDFKLII